MSAHPAPALIVVATPSSGSRTTSMCGWPVVQVQLGIEYDPQPPFGPIDRSAVDRDTLVPLLQHDVSTELADEPDLLAKLID